MPPSVVSSKVEQQLTQQLSQQRHPLLTGLSWLKIATLDGSITPKVVIGKDGWLFLKQEEPDRNTIEQSLGVHHYSELEIKRWNLIFQQREYWSEQHNMQYLLVFAPNKASLYPEHLKDHYKKAPTSNSIDDLKSRLAVDFIDLGAHLKTEKATGRLFQKTDTHWNDLGAFLAYQHLIQALPAPFRDTPITLADCYRQEVEKPSGDLARLLLVDHHQTETNLQISLKDTSAIFQPERSQPIAANLTPLVFSNPAVTRPKVFFDHDSFGKYLVPFLAEHFQESVFLWAWRGFHTDLIKKEKPALIVNQFVERALVGELPRNDWEVIQQYWEAHFDRLSQAHLTATLSLTEMIPWAQKHSRKQDQLAIAKIQIQPSALDKLIVDYANDRGYYWLPVEGQTYYLELVANGAQHLQAEQAEELKGSIEVRYY